MAAYPIRVEPLQIWRGDPITLTLRMLDSVGAKVNLSGFGTTWTAMLRASVSATSKVDWTVDSSHKADGTDPRVILSLTGTQTAALPTGETYGYDVQATGGAVDPFTVWRGEATTAGDYTHG